MYNTTILTKIVDSLKRNLTVDVKNTSAYRRSLTCASDPRPSAAYVGYVGIVFLIITGGLFLCDDLSKFGMKTKMSKKWIKLFFLKRIDKTVFWSSFPLIRRSKDKILDSFLIIKRICFTHEQEISFLKKFK